MYISDLRIFHILMFLYLKFLNFGVKTSFERSFIAFFDLKDRQNDIPKFHDRAVGDWELMTSTQDLISNVISLWEASICFAQISLFVSVCFCLCRRVSVVRLKIVQVRARMRNLKQAITRKWKKKTTMWMSALSTMETTRQLSILSKQFVWCEVLTN